MAQRVAKYACFLAPTNSTENNSYRLGNQSVLSRKKGSHTSPKNTKLSVFPRPLTIHRKPIASLVETWILFKLCHEIKCDPCMFVVGWTAQ
ncbi:hypothetical protein L210DRAFT_562660 [Boletus edulis BED1]|uniref:Uncharacterized protein n=1 Tax=Boletus edulis BED1 TaxID=1328754 RepID=A0AAD4G5S9_BOLED|nr:hypothetical protein L210DRAFT_562660 [Boletus edulis BED1]